MTTETPVIEITREPGQGLYRVDVKPAVDLGQWTASYATHKDAFGYAGGVRMVKGWPIVDLSGG